MLHSESHAKYTAIDIADILLNLESMGNQNIQTMKVCHRNICNDINLPAVVNPDLQNC